MGEAARWTHGMRMLKGSWGPLEAGTLVQMLPLQMGDLGHFLAFPRGSGQVSTRQMKRDKRRPATHRRHTLDAVPPRHPSLLTSMRRPPSPLLPGWGPAAAARDGARRPGAPGPGAPAAAAPGGPTPRRRTRALRRSGAGAAGWERVSESGAELKRSPRPPSEGRSPRPAPGAGEPWPHLF